MAKVLFISPQVLYPQNTGFRKSVTGRILNDYREDDIYVLQINSTGEEEHASHHFFKSFDIKVETIHLPETNKRSFHYCIRYLLSSGSPMPWHAQNLNRDNIRNRIYRLDEEQVFDVIVCEQIYTLNAIPEPLHEKCRVICHNVESGLLLDQASINRNPFIKTAFLFEGIRTYFFEKRIIRQNLDHLYFLSGMDAAQFQHMFRIIFDPIRLTSNILYSEYTLDRTALKDIVLFNGNMTFEPNLHGLLWFVRHLYADFERDFPGYEILVTGRTPARTRKIFAGYSNIRFTGYLDDRDMKILFETCRLIISPILKGSGIRIKNLEALQYNIPIVMTRNSARGLSEFDELDNTPGSFYRLMKEFLKDQSPGGFKSAPGVLP